MYTRCPECETTFRLSAEDLRRAQGRVRCGDCDNVFNALEFLAEDADDTDDSLPVLSSGPAVISSADNPHRADAMFEPANETEAPETIEEPEEEAENASYELEIKAYDEKTGEAWSPLETSTWDSEQIPDVALIDDMADDAIGDNQDWTPTAEAQPSFEAEPPVWQADESKGENSAVDELETGHDTSMLAQDSHTTQTEESSATNYDAEAGLPGFYSDDSPFEAEAFNTEEGTEAQEADAYDAEADDSGINVQDEIAEEDDPLSAESSADEDTDAGPATEEADPDEEASVFDDTIWERIPGVGAAEEQRETHTDLEDEQLADGLSYTGTDFLAVDPDILAEPDNEPDNDPDNDEVSSDEISDEVNDEIPEVSEPTGATDELSSGESNDNELGFDVPENKWSAFFGDAPTPAAHSAADEDEPFEDESDDAGDEVTGFEDEPADEPDFPAPVEDISEESSFDDMQTEAEQKPDDALSGPVTIEFDDPSEPAIIHEDEDPQSADGLVTEMAGVFGDAGEPLDISAETAATDDMPDAEADYEDSSDALDEGDEGDEDSEKSAAPHWADMESIEEVVLSTGEFGAAEIASSLAELKNNSEPDKSKDTDGWRPEHWQPEDEEQDANASQAIPAWKSAYAAAGESKYGKLWLGAIILLIIGFSTQLLHYNRDKLAANPSYGDTTRNIYSALGMELYPNWMMDSYEIRGSEAIAGESGQDVLDIRTQIASVGDATVGLPQLRVVLRDRWSNPVAARTFTPEEYADSNLLPADGMLQSGQTVAAHVAIVDPGSGAQGFELELCLPRRDTGLECTGQPFK